MKIYRQPSGYLKRLEAISKPQIRFENKAKADEKAQHTGAYVSILRRPVTPASGLRWGFKMASNHSLIIWLCYVFRLLKTPYLLGKKLYDCIWIYFDIYKVTLNPFLQLDRRRTLNSKTKIL